MRPYILGERNGIYLIDLRQTLSGLDQAYSFVRDLVARGGTILFVGTKKQAQEPIERYARECGMPFVNQRWLGGMLTNFSTISMRIRKLQEFEQKEHSGEMAAMPKREALQISREIEKLKRNLGGLRDMTGPPQAIFVLDTKKEHLAVTEANKLGLPVVAVVDTNCDPDLVQFVIPGNDDAIRAGALMARAISEAVKEGRFMAARRDQDAQAERARAMAKAAELEASNSAQAAPAADAPAPAAAAEAPAPAPAAEAPAPAPAADAPAPAAAAEAPAPAPAQFSARDVQALRQLTGAGMLDARRALTENQGDSEAAARWLREQGLAKAASRADRASGEGVVALAESHSALAVVEIKCETDFAAKSGEVVELAERLAQAVLVDGESAAASQDEELERLKIAMRENILVGRTVRIERAEGQFMGSYLHRQNGRGVVATLVVLAGDATDELAHDIAVHAAFARPAYVTKDEVPPAEVEAERSALVAITRNEGKPEAAIDKIVEGRLNGWFKERCLLEQPFVRDEKQTVAQMLGSATVVACRIVVAGA